MMKALLATLLLLPQLALANFSLTPALGLYKTDANNSTSQLELRIGYKFDFGLYTGIAYDLNSQKFVEDADEYYISAQIGYESTSGMYLLAGYVIAGDQDLKSGGIKYTGATGLQATFGFKQLLTEDVYLAPEITYRKVSFDSQEIQGVAAPTSRHDSVIIPGIAVQFVF